MKKLSLFLLLFVLGSPAYCEVVVPETGVVIQEYITAGIQALGTIAGFCIAGFVAFLLLRKGLKWLRMSFCESSTSSMQDDWYSSIQFSEGTGYDYAFRGYQIFNVENAPESLMNSPDSIVEFSDDEQFVAVKIDSCRTT